MGDRITIPGTYVAETELTASDLNADLRDNMSSIDAGYGCRVATTTTQTFATETWTALTFDAETFDDDTMHDNSTNPSRITIKSDGRYLIIGSAEFRFSGGIDRALAIYKNGAAVLVNGTFPAYAAEFDWVNIVCVLPLEADDYIEL